MQVEDLSTLKRAGITVCLAPSFNPSVVSEANRLGISFIPGVETISEAMSAITLGAKGLKLFPSFFYEPNGDVTVQHSDALVQFRIEPQIMNQLYAEANKLGLPIGSIGSFRR
jgi:hypothetical protein